MSELSAIERLCEGMGKGKRVVRKYRETLCVIKSDRHTPFEGGAVVKGCKLSSLDLSSLPHVAACMYVVVCRKANRKRITCALHFPTTNARDQA